MNELEVKNKDKQNELQNQLSTQLTSLGENRFRLEVVSEAIRKNYISRLHQMPIARLEDLPELEVDLIRNVRLFQITEMVYSKHEAITEKLATVYNTLVSTHSSVFLIMDSDGFTTRFYLGLRNLEDDNSGLKRSTVSLKETIRQTLIGHFPGMKTKDTDRKGIAELSDKIRSSSNVAAVTVMADPKTEKLSDEKQFVQGLEKLVLAMKGYAWTGMILAENQPPEQVEQLRIQYENLYTKLFPLKTTQISENTNSGTSRQKNFFEMSGMQKFNAVTQLFSAAAGAAGLLSGHPAVGMAASMIGGQLMQAINLISPVESVTEGKGYSQSTSYENKTITNILKVIDKQIERCDSFDSYGMWQTAAYFMSDDLNAAEIAASNYRSLMIGQNTGLEVSSINIWQKRLMAQKEQFEDLTTALSRFVHPQFLYSNNVLVSAATAVSGRELGYHLGLPRSSVPGLPVIEHAEFGKEVVSYQLIPQEKADSPKEKITLGHIFDLGQITNKLVELNNRSLNMHTFITGSTGSGKSNAVYQMLSELRQDRIPFLVIEPAKGEYKDVFGHLPDVRVFSTNPKAAPLIHINPFMFPDSIHVLEHVDGLVEIFSVCWPMYDAMPAFFKEAILKSYEAVGWDLGTSTFEGDNLQYPDFDLLADQLDALIGSSDYAAEIKSNYRGALLTRVRSLTVGLNKYIFSQGQTPYAEIFDENCILDISRVKSQETKAFIMGILVYLLNEYRSDQKTESNLGLAHVTVLEEAHNLLKNVQDGQNTLTGKSVEILTNTIAEIRTYGEGFIIVDQSPSSVDIAAIKNTNTKIVLRTPEANDREAIGRSMGLNQDQVEEIAKLPSGVAVVYQNNWIDPVMTMIEKADIQEIPYVNPAPIEVKSAKTARTELMAMLLSGWIPLERLDVKQLQENLNLLKPDRNIKEKLDQIICEYDFTDGNLDWKESDIPVQQSIMFSLLGLDSRTWEHLLLQGPYAILDHIEKSLQTDFFEDPELAVNQVGFVLTIKGGKNVD